jgi:hypothetical protein
MFYLYLATLVISGLVPGLASAELGLPHYASVLIGVVTTACIWLVSRTSPLVLCGAVTSIVFAASSFLLHPSKHQILYTALHGLIGFSVGLANAKVAKGQL